jgi:hypothetical protein
MYLPGPTLEARGGKGVYHHPDCYDVTGDWDGAPTKPRLGESEVHAWPKSGERTTAQEAVRLRAGSAPASHYLGPTPCGRAMLKTTEDDWAPTGRSFLRKP